MDTTDPEIVFDDQGNCNHCSSAIQMADKVWHPNKQGEEMLLKIINKVKEEEKNKEYDCIIGLSGGVDSSYLAYKVLELGLRPLVVHVDCGWNSELAVKNVENIVKKLSIDLHTHVIDWQEMKDLQLSFFKANVPNQDVPQDHAIFSSLYSFAVKNNIKYVFNGSNFATESILPQAWGYNADDYKHLKSIHKIYGNKRLKKYPKSPFFKRYFYYRFVRKMTVIKPLNYMSYNKEDAVRVLKDKFDWKFYGEKHHESRFTKFFQAYYLPTKFGYDKRRAHLSSMIISNQLSRESALNLMQKEVYPNESYRDDMEYVAKKLDLSVQEFQNIINMPNKSHKDYKSNEKLFELGLKINQRINKIVITER